MSKLRLFVHANKVHNATVRKKRKPLLVAEHGAAERMDPELIDSALIYAKTASGEEAMLQRTRVVQRNLRMVLILVDGNATVAELCDKTGNAQLTQNALLELEDDGFIERRIDKDSVWNHGRKLAQAAKDNAKRGVSEFSTFGDRSDPAPAGQSSPGGEPTRIIPFPEDRQNRFLPDPPSSPSVAPSVPPPTDSVTGPESRTVFLSKEEASPEAVAGGAPTASLLARLRAFFESSPQEGEGPDLRSLRRSYSGVRLSWPLAVMLGVALLSALLVLLALFFPYARYLPAVEAALTESTGQKASVDEMRVTFYPQPGLLLGNVRLGDAASGERVRIGEMRLRPLLGTLLSSRIMFQEIQLSDVELSARAFTTLSGMFRVAAREAGGARVQRVTVTDADVGFAGLGFHDLSGDLALSDDGIVQSVSLQSSDRSLHVFARLVDEKLQVSAEGLAWVPSPKSPYRFDSFSLKGEVDGPVFVIDEIELRIFGGRIRGAVILRGDGPPAMAGEITFERISSASFGKALGIGEQFEGDASGDLRFSATSRTWSTILLAVNAEGNFTMSRGSLGGIDLPEAARRVSTVPATLGGATRFEQLSGVIGLTPDRYRFSRLVLSAGTMLSTGQIEVSRDLQLRGRMDVQMRGRDDHSALPVSISGSLKTPLLVSR